jgi:hypothetical protein
MGIFIKNGKYCDMTAGCRNSEAIVAKHREAKRVSKSFYSEKATKSNLAVVYLQ